MNNPFEDIMSSKPWMDLPETETDEEEQENALPPEEEEVFEEDNEEDFEEQEEQQAEVALPEQQQFELPNNYEYGDLDDEFGEDPTPAGFKQLFDPKGTSDLTKLTETPPKMVLPLVRAEVIDAAYDVKRMESGQSLLSVFVQAFDRRMISKDRKGRLEAVELIRGLSRGEAGDEEEASL